MTLLSFDVVELLRDSLAADRRPPDGRLHPSGDLIGSLRHAQLRAAGAPTVESDVVSDTRLMTGTLWHSHFEAIFSNDRSPTMTEVKLDRWLPEGWSGTADWVIWNPEAGKHGAFVLGDLKTTKGEGIKFIQSKGIKEEHLWQLSAYWYALEAMGVPLVHGFEVLYLPLNAPPREPNVGPTLQTGTPLPREVVYARMEDRWAETKLYLEQVSSAQAAAFDAGTRFYAFLQEALAPVQGRVQALRMDKKAGVYNVVLAPHWSAAYCPYDNKLCDCSEQGITKIGHWESSDSYVSRKGHEDQGPQVQPTDAEWRRL